MLQADEVVIPITLHCPLLVCHFLIGVHTHRNDDWLHSTGAYRVSAFFLAKSLATAPIEIFQICFFAVIVYFMVGYQATPVKFFIYLITLVLFALTSETIGYLCAICTKSSHDGAAFFDKDVQTFNYIYLPDQVLKDMMCNLYTALNASIGAQG